MPSNWIANSGPRILEAIKKAFTEAFDWLRGRVSAVWDAIGGGEGKGSEAYSGALKSIDNALKSVSRSPVGKEIGAAVTGLENSPLGQELAPGKREARGIRNNNPGNLNYVGQTGATKEEGPNGRFAVFQSAQEGLNALAGQLRLYAKRGVDTVEGMISKFAPPSENNTRGYIDRVSTALGVSSEQRIDVSDPGVISSTIVRVKARPADGPLTGPGSIVMSTGYSYERSLVVGAIPMYGLPLSGPEVAMRDRKSTRLNSSHT